MYLLSSTLTFATLIVSSFAQESPVTVGSGETTTDASGGTTATPTGPVISVTFPADVENGQVLVGSLVGTASQLTTIAVSCPEGTADDDCGFSGDAVLTAGTATLELTVSYDRGYTVRQNCDFSSEGGACTITVPVASDDSPSSSGAVSTSITSFGADAITSAGIVITAGDTAGLSAPISTAASTTSPRASGIPVPTEGGTDILSSTGLIPTSTPTTENDARVLIPGSIGAMLMGVAAVLL